MLYHKKARKYLSGYKDGAYFDSTEKRYFIIEESVEEVAPEFFMIKEEVLEKIRKLGYAGENNVREILDYLKFEYKIDYSEGFYSGFMVTGKNSDLLEAHIRIGNKELTNFLSITVHNIDERSPIVMMKEVIDSMTYFFEVKEDGGIIGPDTACFERNIRKGST